MTDPKKPVQRLTIYRIKAGWVADGAFLRHEEVAHEHRIELGRRKAAVVYTKTSSPNPPKWASFFEGQIPPDSISTVSTASALMVVAVTGVTYALAFGQGRHLLEQDSHEERFGLLVTLNTLGDESIKSIDKKRFDAILKQAREQASKESNPIDFGMDIEQDLLRSITGRPQDPSLGRRLTGMDALTAVVRVDLETLPELLERYSQCYESEEYKKSFPWVDHFSEVKDGELIHKLELEVIRLIREREQAFVWLCAPDIIDWDRVYGFRYGFRNRNPVVFDIDISGLLDELKDDEEPSIEWLQKKKIFCVDEYDSTIAKWSAFKCLYAEVVYRDETYLLSGGGWYRVTKEFVEAVDTDVQKIPHCDYPFPVYDHKGEGDYNEEICDQDPVNAVLMDKKNIQHGGGYSKIEFCDVFISGTRMVHVKRYGGSSTLSHLFAQGVVSGELFQSDFAFREKVNERLPAESKIADLTTPPGQQGYEVVFGIISVSPGEELNLPFFSRLGLKYAGQRLGAFGYKVSVAKIPVADERAKWSRYK